MATVTVPMESDLREKLKTRETNWSQYSKTEIRKRMIFDDYRNKRTISEDDWAFCDAIDWHPVDELPMRPEFVRKILGAEQEMHMKPLIAHDLEQGYVSDPQSPQLRKGDRQGVQKKRRTRKSA